MIPPQVIPYAIGALAFGALFFAGKLWVDGKVEEGVRQAGIEAAAVAHEERAEFEQSVARAIGEIQAESAQRAEKVERRFDSWEELQRSDWDADLQTSDDFDIRATDATGRVYDHRQSRLQEIFAGGIGLPRPATTLPRSPEGG